MGIDCGLKGPAQFVRRGVDDWNSVINDALRHNEPSDEQLGLRRSSRGDPD
jgi:hypothetical protein